MKKILSLLLILITLSATSWGQTISVFAGNGFTGGNIGVSGVAATMANVAPVGTAVDTSHNFYYIDWAANSINEIANGSGTITVIAGAYNIGPNGNVINGYGGDGGNALLALFNHPMGLCVDDTGNVFVADLANYRIREIRKSTGIITTIAGTGVRGNTGNGGIATNATLGAPYSLACDLAAAHIYVVDQYANEVRLIQGDSIYQFAGTGNIGAPVSGHGFDTTNFNEPEGIAYDDSGNLYVADHNNECIQKLNKVSGLVSVYAGNQTAGFSGDGGAAASAMLNGPCAVSTDATGNLFIADQLNNRIRKVTNSTRVITTSAGNGAQQNSGMGGSPTAASVNTPFGITVDANGKHYFCVNGYYVLVY